MMNEAETDQEITRDRDSLMAHSSSAGVDAINILEWFQNSMNRCC